MEKNRIRICGSANRALIKMSGGTGLTANILARIGFCLSLNQPTPPDPEQYKIGGEKDFREFNRITLFGNNSFIYVALLKQKSIDTNNKQNISIDDLLVAHLNRGALLLAKKGNNIADLITNNIS
jgi:DNA sulfur modification protein DndE